MSYTNCLNPRHKFFPRVMPLLLVIIFGLTQVSTLLASSQTTCIDEPRSTLTPVLTQQAQRCCCSEMGSCCCDVSQKSRAPWPDMTLTKISGGEFDPTSRWSVLDTAFKIVLPPQNHKLTGIWTRAGPSLAPNYLLNLPLRC